MKLHDGILTTLSIFIYHVLFCKIASIGTQNNGLTRLEKYKYLAKALT